MALPHPQGSGPSRHSGVTEALKEKERFSSQCPDGGIGEDPSWPPFSDLYLHGLVLSGDVLVHKQPMCRCLIGWIFGPMPRLKLMISARVREEFSSSGKLAKVGWFPPSPLSGRRSQGACCSGHGHHTCDCCLQFMWG